MEEGTRVQGIYPAEAKRRVWKTPLVGKSNIGHFQVEVRVVKGIEFRWISVNSEIAFQAENFTVKVSLESSKHLFRPAREREETFISPERSLI